MEDESRDEEETVTDDGEDGHGKEKPWYPYITKTQFEKFLSRLQSKIPEEIDRDYVRAIIRTPSMIYRFLRGVEAMGLIDEAQRPTERLHRLVDKETRKQALSEVVRDLYPILMDKMQEAGGEMADRDVVAFFRKETGMGNDSANKMKMFFKYLLSEADESAADGAPTTPAPDDTAAEPAAEAAPEATDAAEEAEAPEASGEADSGTDEARGDDGSDGDDDDGEPSGNKADPPQKEAASQTEDRGRGGPAERRSQRGGGNDRSGNSERSGSERGGGGERSGNSERSGSERGQRGGGNDRSGNSERGERGGGNDRSGRGEREEREERSDRGGRGGRGGRDRASRNERVERTPNDSGEREADRTPNNRPLTEAQRAYLDTLKSVLRVNVDGDWDDDMIRLAFDRLERLFDRIRRG
jgi:hypothetical protein